MLLTVKITTANITFLCDNVEYFYTGGEGGAQVIVYRDPATIVFSCPLKDVVSFDVRPTYVV